MPPPPPPTPNLTVSTTASASASISKPDDEPIPPPPVSPITPTLPPARLPDATPQAPLPSPLTRPLLTHSQPDQVAVPPPAPRLIDFESNPDVIALKSAISVLQVQKKRAAADMQALDRAKDAAIEDPDAFLRDLVAGKVNAPPATAQSDSDDDEGDESQERLHAQPREWASLPKPQDVVRCPPINWAQYAVVGSSLDKLHAQEVSHPTQGAPASIGTNGIYEFKGDGKRDKYPGVAAPYAPTKDRIERKPKGKK
ncbi:hypothetical protein HIM_03955 [Hirsutella minnesotensis 3608]|uniref:Uncharacterized protein n=1 Tax=Hirsutella minnesotensis 3608 TaxID=1043627 RepID=A0A0F8A681_9HYPO|nr:hypothetical protein HIM_03955 [Hirsutella minnesotensis 3608]